MTAPDVSIIIPTRDRWRFLRRAIAVALNQEHVKVEVIIVIDGGTDQTADRLAEMTDARLRVLHFKENVGVARARNAGAAMARARWLSFLDDDDFWAPDRTRRLLDQAMGADLVAGGVFQLSERRSTGLMVPPEPAALRSALLVSNAIGGPSNAIVSNEAFTATGGYDPEFEVLADWDLWLRVLDGRRSAVVEEPVNAYVIHPEGMHRTKTVAATDEFDRLRRKHPDLANTYGTGFAHEHYMRWIGDTHLDAGRSLNALRVHGRNVFQYHRAEDLRRIAAVLAGARLRQLRARRRIARQPDLPAWVREWSSPAAPNHD